ncbi:hypothetical protein [Streptomyces griseoaurantiacus]|uniref:Uncharacterized protein n=1 Tax=Streptomyces griseoaurantiacus TaxID=68213 RepID=A0A7W2HUL4_9ACTN|nr:hypothetical protein [Streptomyces griseoaurantiacus]MBA5222236.1 hypothetical protein [Streptomyces griseoaurantiacus]
MLYILRAHRKQQDSRRVAAALEAVADAYTEHCRTLREKSARLLAHLDKDEPHDSRNPR